MKKIFIALLFLIIFVSCSNSTNKTIKEENNQKKIKLSDIKSIEIISSNLSEESIKLNEKFDTLINLINTAEEIDNLDTTPTGNIKINLNNGSNILISVTSQKYHYIKIDGKRTTIKDNGIYDFYCSYYEQ